jgi:hypothetical protein
MDSIIHPTQTTDAGNYLRFVSNACTVPHDFIAGMHDRIMLAYRTGETVEMIAEEVMLRYVLRGRAPHKTPRALATSVVKVTAPELLDALDAEIARLSA